MTMPTDLATRIRELGLPEVSRMTGIATATLSRQLTGKQSPTPRTIAAIRNALDVHEIENDEPSFTISTSITVPGAKPIKFYVEFPIADLRAALEASDRAAATAISQKDTK